ncbi:MAG: hypothetical protein MUF23_01175 [Pirellula sp.]|nr:hypothetical protein [Pirellula sp.]
MTSSKSQKLYLVFFLFLGCMPSKQEATPVVATAPPAATQTTTSENHEHKPGDHGGIIVSLGRDSYHVEAVFDDQGKVRLFTLGQDETRVIDIEAKELNGFVKSEGATEAQSIAFVPDPQPGDAPGRTSLFIAKLPESLTGKAVEITVPNLSIDGERFRLAFTNATTVHAGDSHALSSMPSKVSDDEEEALYLQPGGHYTEEDIAANGRTTPYQKFRGIPSTHDMNPKPGDRICPITETKANPKFVWIIGGKSYQFCCPPCIDEFLQTAKSAKSELPDPDSFILGESKP